MSLSDVLLATGPMGIETAWALNALKGASAAAKGAAAAGNVTKAIVSTGRTVPKTLSEKLAMEAVKAKPAGVTPPRMPAMNDAKNGLFAVDGWVKRVQNVNGVEVHYVENTKTGEFSDFKCAEPK